MLRVVVEEYLALDPVYMKVYRLPSEVDAEHRGWNVYPTDGLIVLKLHDVGWVLSSSDDFDQITDLWVSSFPLLK